WAVMGVGGSVLGPLSYSLGQVGLLQDRHRHAADDYERALCLSRSMRARPYEAHSLLGLSKALEPTDRARATELRDEALAIAQELGGMARLLRDAGAG
ncbi:MAG TPA: hypothetical protein VEQ61_05365, partial [Thermoleophilaceae bacterium]|nr:hypothetical protein [Thermoleophilaceae bacterium]